jgi:hypothetical protein
MNFTRVDTLGVIRACLALAPCLFAPGYALGWAFNPFLFRQQRPLVRFVLAVPLSISFCPIISYLLARFFPPGLWVFYIGATTACLLLLALEIRRVRLACPSKEICLASVFLLLWAVAALGSLVDLQIGDKLYSPVAAYDHSTRVAMTAAIARQIPPNNPFFAHPAVPLRYHYLWNLVCSLPLKVFSISPRHLVYGGILWCGIGLFSTIAFSFKFLVKASAGPARMSFIALALLCVTGLDILPTLYVAAHGLWLADMEWWQDAPITSWASSLIWVPHHLAALIACLLGFLLLRQHVESQRNWGAPAVLVAGIAFASASGMSVYVTFTFVVAIALWLMALVVRKDWKEISMFVAAGTIAALLSLPYLYSLKGSAAGGANEATAFVELALRPFSAIAYILQLEGGMNHVPGAVTMVANVLLLPLNYALELGFFLVVAILRLRQMRRRAVAITANELSLWTLVAASFLIGTFLQSSTITTNDLGIRCFLPAQFVLLLWGAELVEDWWFAKGAPKTLPPLWVRRTVAALLVVGVLGTAYEVFMIRMAPVLYDRWGIAGIGWMEPDWKLGKRNYAVRSLYEALNAQLPSSATIQHNPNTKNFIPHGLYSGHDAAAGAPDCGIAFGGDPQLCRQRVARLAALFANQGNPERVCQDYQLDVLVAKDTDPAWRDRTSWVWSEPPLVANAYARAFRCGMATAGIKP